MVDRSAGQRVRDGYAIVPAEARHLRALPAIELAAAELLRGHAPEHVLAETTDNIVFSRAAEAGRLWIAVRRDRPVGFALIEMLADDLPHLEEIDVAPGHGRRGVGTALVRAVCDWASRHGYAALTLTTFRDVPWNMPFYAKLGFVEQPAAALRPELTEVVAHEAARGLAANRRVVMQYDCERPVTSTTA
jgi:GNAT superfamily N-acetyltransferase